ncbi:hypothetical protein [Tunturiibacter psychrotolerans]|uniref:hypothetical protein n=1 Tax=Tunturiibacter psychrotolerans TaxID=3069686 RepID=UPI003D1E2C9F
MKDKLKREIYLINSNRRAEDAPFLNLLDDLAAEHPHFHFIPTMTKMKSLHPSWAGETGKLTPRCYRVITLWDKTCLLHRRPARDGDCHAQDAASGQSR